MAPPPLYPVVVRKASIRRVDYQPEKTLTRLYNYALDQIVVYSRGWWRTADLAA